MRDALITEILGDGPHDFRLAYGNFLELQEKTGVGPFTLYRRFNDHEWQVQDIYETIRIGLIGGGMKPRDAYVLAKRYVMDQPPLDNLKLAQIILIAGLHGAPDEDRAGSKRDDKSAESEDVKLKSRSYYGAGAVAGYTPQDINAMSLHQLKAALDGFSDYHSASNGKMTEDVASELFDMVLEEQDRIDGVVPSAART